MRRKTIKRGYSQQSHKIKTKGQLCDMIKVRSAISGEKAVADVEKWMAGKNSS
jgi:hypothetical protein